MTVHYQLWLQLQAVVWSSSLDRCTCLTRNWRGMVSVKKRSKYGSIHTRYIFWLASMSCVYWCSVLELSLRTSAEALALRICSFEQLGSYLQFISVIRAVVLYQRTGVLQISWIPRNIAVPIVQQRETDSRMWCVLHLCWIPRFECLIAVF